MMMRPQSDARKRHDAPNIQATLAGRIAMRPYPCGTPGVSVT